MFMERVSDQFSKSPQSSVFFFKGNDSTSLKQPFPLLTTGNFTAINSNLDSEALEKIKKILGSPDSSQSPTKNPEIFTLKSGENSKISISPEALSRAQRFFDSPNQGNKEEKEKQTEEIEKKGTKNGLPIGIRAGIIRHNRGELSCNSRIQPKFVNLTNNTKSLATLEKRRADSPPCSFKTVPKHRKSETSSLTLIELNKMRPLKGFFNSNGLLVTADNAENFVFYCNCYTGGCNCSRNGMGFEDFYDSLIQEGYKCTKEWVAHHYRLVVWKYASYERRISPLKGIFSVCKVLENLKKRYQSEIMESKRGILKKIIENDEIPSKRMVLCIGIINNLGKTYSIELTDGWSSIWFDVSNDNLFFPLLQRKILHQGLKIEVIGCSLHENKLILPYNSTRRAAWNRKLGEVPSPYPFPVLISSIKESGGTVCRISGYVSRVYPLIYIEGNTLRSRSNVSDPSSCFFECLVKDAVIDYNKEKSQSTFIKIKSSASEIFENLKLGTLVNFYFISPSRPKNFKRMLIFNHKSKITYGKKERKDLVKVRKLADNKCKQFKEVDCVGIVTSVQRTHNNEISYLNLAGAHGNIKVIIHNPGLFGRVLQIIEPSTLKYMKIIAFLNVVMETKKNAIIEVKTTNNTEIIHSNFPSHMMQQIAALKEFNLNSLLSHRLECDHFGCICGLE